MTTLQKIVAEHLSTLDRERRRRRLAEYAAICRVLDSVGDDADDGGYDGWLSAEDRPRWRAEP